METKGPRPNFHSRADDFALLLCGGLSAFAQTQTVRAEALNNQGVELADAGN